LTLEDIRITSDGGTGRTLANDIVLNGDVGMGGTTASGLMSLTGNMSVTGTGTRTISLQNSSGNDSANSFTLGAASKRITGDGTLALVNGNPSGAIRATLTSVIDVNLSIGSNVTATISVANVFTSNASVQVDGRMRLGNTGSSPFSQTIKSLSGNGAIDSGQTSGSNAPTLTIDGGAGTGSSNFSGVIENGSFGSVVVVKSGSNTQVFSGTNTYTGTTTVNGGVLQFAKATSLYAGTEANWTAAKIIVNSGGTLAFNVGNSASGEFTSGNITTILSNLTGSSSSATTGMKSGSAFGFDTTNADGGSFTVSGVVRNGNSNGNQTVGLTKLGSGTLVLSGTNTYTGATLVSAGTLLVNGSTSASSAVSVGSGAALGGSGTINGSVSINSGATLNPGTAATLTLGQTLTFGSESTLAFTLGSNSSKIVFSSPGNNLLGNGNATLSLTLGDGFNYGATYRIFENSSTTGFSFADIVGYDDANFTATFAQFESNYDLTFAAIPEPSTYMLLVLAGLAVLSWGIRKRAGLR
jgi:autotransporter-associated beta strand protein